MAILESARTGLKGFIWFFKGLMGEDAYAKYRAHHRTVQGTPDASQRPMTEREFWRDKMDRQENNPQGRCC